MSVMFRAEDEPVVSRVDYWRHLAEETVVPLELRVGGSRDFRSQIRAGQIDAVQVTEMTRTARPGRSDRRAHPPVGRGRRAVPTSAASAPPTEMDRLTGVRIAGDRGAGALFSSVAREVVAHLDDYGAADAARLGTTMVDLLTTALAAQLDHEDELPSDSHQQALLRRVHAFIEQRLADPSLSPRMIAAAHHVSVRYLYKLFETQPSGTGVAAWIRERRLERSRRDLLDPALAARPVSAIAARWGLTEPAHFSRLFRAAYGLPPDAYRRTIGGPS